MTERRRLEGHQTQMLHHGHLATEQVAKSRSRRLSTHRGHQMTVRGEFCEPCEHASGGDDDDGCPLFQRVLSRLDGFFGVPAVARGHDQPGCVKPGRKAIISVDHHRTTSVLCGEGRQKIASGSASAHAQTEHSAPGCFSQFFKPEKRSTLTEENPSLKSR